MCPVIKKPFDDKYPGDVTYQAKVLESSLRVSLGHYWNVFSSKRKPVVEVVGAIAGHLA